MHVKPGPTKELKTPVESNRGACEQNLELFLGSGKPPIQSTAPIPLCSATFFPTLRVSKGITVVPKAFFEILTVFSICKASESVL